MLPSGRYIIVERIYQNECIGCVFVNADGSPSLSRKGQPKVVTFTPEFMFKHCARVR